MASTLLAVDDSVTMRKVLEITFAGTDLHLITANHPDAALTRIAADRPELVIADVTLEPKSGYDLCAAVKQAVPGTRVLILSSKQNPFDAAKGASVGADDHIDKPFDTQQLIDKVRKLLEGKKDAPAAAATLPAVAAPARTVTQPSLSTPVAPQARAKTLMFGQPGQSGQMPAFMEPPKAKPSAGSASPTPPAGVAVARTPAAAPAARPSTTHMAAPVAAPAPMPAPAHVAAPAPMAAAPVAAPAPMAAAPAAAASPARPAAAHVGSAVNGHMTAKLEGMGLTTAQVDAVLALSREVIERVVWEVVPVLAETIIKEEISRLTK